ncbi:MAG: response regulator [Lachnospiraceae bacterium]|nr:response regulator [Lachnospiraceae bacterium]
MHRKILIVDDSDINRGILTEILEDEHPVMVAVDGREALDLLEEFHDDIAVVLLDLMMPEMDGFAVLEVMKKRGWMEKIPVLVITGEDSVEIERKSFEYGASDFVRKPFDNILVKRRVNNITDLYMYKDRLEHKVEEQTKTLQEQNELLKVQADRLKENNARILDALGTIVESRNLESGEHIKRVKDFTRILAEELMKDYPEYELTPDKVEVIVSASSMHDIGKIAIPDNILLKPARLTQEEFECMKTHTTRGCDILKSIKGAWDDKYGEACYEICRYHHERYDGRGYPDGLVGEEIPISAQIVSVADVYDALVSERVYKSAYSKDEAFHMIMRGECGTFSPKLLNCFKNARKQMEDMVTEQKEGAHA